MLKLLTDEALGEGNDINLDGLGFSTYSNVIADAAKGTRGPFTIGIFGEWGTGKTSLMRMVENRFSDDKTVITVWFNAWRYEKEEHPIVPLIATIVREVELHKNALEKLKDGGASLVRALRAVAYGFSAKSKVKIPGFAEIEASFVAKDMIERESTLKPDPLLDRSLYYESFEKLSSVYTSEDIKIIVLVDDLDRCFPNLAIKLLESIKLVLSQKGFVFILGVARSVIEGYLQFRYQTRYGIKNFQGQAYLDKIVQLPFHIPSHRGRMHDFSSKIIERIDNDCKSQIEIVMPIVSSASGSNPRATVRFVNNLLIDVAINRELAKHDQMSEISIQYFAVSRCLQLRWPQIFSILTSSDDICEKLSKWDPDNLRAEASSDDPDQASVAATLLGDRDLKLLLYSESGISWLIEHIQRRATVEFLETQRQETITHQEKEYNEYDVFFSYDSNDRESVTAIAEYLAKNDLRVFMDTKIPFGASVKNYIYEAVKNSRALVLFLGNNYGKKTNISGGYLSFHHEFGELLNAFENKDHTTKIIPILLPGADIDSVPDEIKKYKYLDWRNGYDENNIIFFAKVLKKA